MYDVRQYLLITCRSWHPFSNLSSYNPNNYHSPSCDGVAIDFCFAPSKVVLQSSSRSLSYSIRFTVLSATYLPIRVDFFAPKFPVASGIHKTTWPSRHGSKRDEGLAIRSIINYQPPSNIYLSCLSLSDQTTEWLSLQCRFTASYFFSSLWTFDSSFYKSLSNVLVTLSTAGSCN